MLPQIHQCMKKPRQEASIDKVIFVLGGGVVQLQMESWAEGTTVLLRQRASVCLRHQRGGSQ
eukprot:6198028-Pleurochrysis_carterae.AAC.9